MSEQMDTFDPVWLRATLLEQGIHPEDVGTLLRYLPVALTHLCWRNSVVEEWHGGPESRIGDADMMRANVATTRLIHQSLWFAIGESWAESGPLSWQVIDAELLDAVLFDTLETCFSGERVLPHGISLGELGGDQIGELDAHAEAQMNWLSEMAEERGVEVVVMWLALRGVLTVPRWWGTPQWPFVVDEFMRRLDAPDHPHWRAAGQPGTPPRPADDRRWLRRMLVTAPDELPTEVVEWCIYEGAIGFVLPD